MDDDAPVLDDNAGDIYGALDGADKASVAADTLSDDSDANNTDDNDDGDDNNPDDADELARAAGLCRSSRSMKGSTTRYDQYGLLMHPRREACGGPRWALIRDGFMILLDEDLSDAKPIPVEDRDEYALGVILQQYSIGAGLKKFKEQSQVGVTKELTQMHNMSVFTPVIKESLSAEEKKKAVSSLMFLKEKLTQ